ncbi:MAG: AraC family transcriptional regulator ligand-binding domain-containing protein [Actinomycetota bacterium]
MSQGKYALDPGARVMLSDLGLRPASVLRRAGLRADLLAGGPVWLSQEEFFALWTSIEEEAGDPNLPLRIEDVFSAEIFAPSIFAALMSPNLNLAARRIATYKRLIGPMRLLVDITSNTTTIGYRWPNGERPPLVVALSELMFWIELARRGTRRRVEPVQVVCPELPDDLEAYRDYAGVDLQAGSVQSVVFSAGDGAAPFVTANEMVWEAFEPELRRRLADLEQDAAAVEQVRAVLLELLPVGRSSMGDIASELAMSTRTLHRRLAAEGTTFQRVLDRTREDLARHYLADPDISAADISFLLGYEETSSFYRAFHNWTGDTPEQVRTATLAVR